MKETIKTSRTAGYLEKIFRAINADWFGGELEEPIITIQSTPRAYGHVTVAKIWKRKGEQRHELNIGAETLQRPIEEVVATITHRADTLHLFQVTVSACNSIHNVLIGSTGFYKLNDFISVTGFALMLHGHLAAFFKGVGKVDTFMKVAAGVLVGVRAVRLLVELRAVLENIGPVFRGFTTGNVTVERGETSINRSMTQRRRADEINMSMKSFTFIPLFIAHTPIDESGQVEHSGLDTGMVKIMLNGIVDGDKPFPRLWHKNQPP